MNDKQRAFVQEYLTDLNATQAAIRAGYSAKTAGAMAHKLLKNADIQEAITLGQAERAKRTEITMDQVLEGFASIAFSGDEDTRDADRLKALELIGKHLGMFTDRHLVMGDGGAPLAVSLVPVSPRRIEEEDE